MHKSKTKKYNERNKLKGCIREFGYSYEQFAVAIGIGTTALSDKLNGYYMFTDVEIETICELLDIDASEIGIYFFPAKLSNSAKSTKKGA